MNETVLDQIISIRNSGIVNMCDVRAVQRIAFDHDFFELVNYIEEDPAQYFHFIITGVD